MFKNYPLNTLVRGKSETTVGHLCERTAQEKVEVQIMQRKWCWIGYVLGKPSTGVTKHSLQWKQR